MRKKTLLLCFIHGFKGDDDTFDGFPQDLKVLISNALPHLIIKTVVYPRYETRGDLASSVANFREWLQTRVIELEVAAGTPSPIIDPSVRTILVAHSMGGIVAADALLSIVDDESVTFANGRTHKKGTGFMFPYIQGILAFDTPYLGLPPIIFAHGADTHLRNADTHLRSASAAVAQLNLTSGGTSAVAQLSALASGLFATKAANEASNVVQKQHEAKEAKEAKEARRRSESSSSKSPSKETAVALSAPAPVAPANLFGGWGKVMAYAGAASILAAGGAVAYLKGAVLATWVSSHMEFVGALVKTDEMRNRLRRATAVPGVGFADYYTALGERGAEKGERTFVTLPSMNSEHYKLFHRCVNPKVKDEVEAHVSMFSPKSNPWYYEMSTSARDQIAEWVKGDWSEERRGSPERSQGPGRGERL